MDLSPRPIGRPRSCDCGVCKRCKHADYMRRWYQDKTPQERRAWVALRDPERVAAHERARAGSTSKLESIVRSKVRHRERHLARVAVNNALRRGLISKGVCHCGSTTVEGHHPDYDNRLAVEWLCRRHHVERHLQTAATT